MENVLGLKIPARARVVMECRGGEAGSGEGTARGAGSGEGTVEVLDGGDSVEVVGEVGLRSGGGDSVCGKESEN